MDIDNVSPCDMAEISAVTLKDSIMRRARPHSRRIIETWWKGKEIAISDCDDETLRFISAIMNVMRILPEE